MSSLLIYATKVDADKLRRWINGEPNIAWIIKMHEHDQLYEWRAVHEIDCLQEQQYAIWHVNSGALNIPSGSLTIPDTVISDPFEGWTQALTYSGATVPWFGANLPGPYSFTFAEKGIEAPGSLARSEFNWDMDRYKLIGKPANPEAKKWWKKLRRFLEANCVRMPWVTPPPSSGRNPFAFMFPEAYQQITAGRHRDINPWLPNRVS
jgi:hypothetical protein